MSRGVTCRAAAVCFCFPSRQSCVTLAHYPRVLAALYRTWFWCCNLVRMKRSKHFAEISCARWLSAGRASRCHCGEARQSSDSALRPCPTPDTESE